MSKLLTNYFDDEYVNRLVVLAMSTDDEDELIRWSLYCHARMEEKQQKQQTMTPPPVPRKINYDRINLAA